MEEAWKELVTAYKNVAKAYASDGGDVEKYTRRALRALKKFRELDAVKKAGVGNLLPVLSSLAEKDNMVNEASSKFASAYDLAFQKLSQATKGPWLELTFMEARNAASEEAGLIKVFKNVLDVHKKEESIAVDDSADWEEQELKAAHGRVERVKQRAQELNAIPKEAWDRLNDFMKNNKPNDSRLEKLFAEYKVIAPASEKSEELPAELESMTLASLSDFIEQHPLRAGKIRDRLLEYPEKIKELIGSSRNQEKSTDLLAFKVYVDMALKGYTRTAIETFYNNIDIFQQYPQLVEHIAQQALTDLRAEMEIYFQLAPLNPLNKDTHESRPQNWLNPENAVEPQIFYNTTLPPGYLDRLHEKREVKKTPVADQELVFDLDAEPVQLSEKIHRAWSDVLRETENILSKNEEDFEALSGALNTLIAEFSAEGFTTVDAVRTALMWLVQDDNLMEKYIENKKGCTALVNAIMENSKSAPEELAEVRNVTLLIVEAEMLPDFLLISLCELHDNPFPKYDDKIKDIPLELIDKFLAENENNADYLYKLKRSEVFREALAEDSDSDEDNDVENSIHEEREVKKTVMEELYAYSNELKEKNVALKIFAEIKIPELAAKLAQRYCEAYKDLKLDAAPDKTQMREWIERLNDPALSFQDYYEKLQEEDPFIEKVFDMSEEDYRAAKPEVRQKVAQEQLQKNVEIFAEIKIPELAELLAQRYRDALDLCAPGHIPDKTQLREWIERLKDPALSFKEYQRKLKQEDPVIEMVFQMSEEDYRAAKPEVKQEVKQDVQTAGVVSQAPKMPRQ